MEDVESEHTLTTKYSRQNTLDALNMLKKMGFVNLGKLGGGGNGEVFLCKHPSKYNKKEVALKVVNNPRMDFTKHQPMEYVITKYVNTVVPNTVQCLGVITLKNDIYVLVLQYYKNYINLFDYMQTSNVTPQIIRKVMLDAVYINLNLDKWGIVHGDIKDNNFLIHPDTLHLVLIDFGAAQYYKPVLRRYGGPIMSIPPEFVERKEFYAEKSTVWELGIMLYQCLTGKCPWTWDVNQSMKHNKFRVKYEVMHVDPPQNSFASFWKTLIDGMLKKDPQDRFDYNSLIKLLK